MERTDDNQAADKGLLRRVAAASLIGTTIEWYDYFIFGTTAGLVFNQLFFPSFSDVAGTLAAFASFAVGFFARPLGGVIFGHFGDKIGRKSMLIMTLFLMGGATFLIGLLPGYGTIGVFAPLLLVLLRLIQGIGLGGEWGGAALMISEHAPAKRRGFYASSVQMGAAGGLILASGAIAAVSALTTSEQYMTWAWRIPFLASVILVAIGLYVRISIEESEAFKRLRSTESRARLPIAEVFRTRWRNVLLAAGVSSGNNVVFYAVSVFTVSYAVNQLGRSQDAMLNYVLITAAVYFVTLPIFGALSDRVGRRRLILVSAIVMGIVAFPYFWVLNAGGAALIILAMVFYLAVFQSAAYAPQSSFIPELFDTRVRYSGAALGYNLATMVFGGTAPFIATALFSAAGQQIWPVAVYIMFICAVSLVSVYLATDAPMLRDDRENEAPAAPENPVRH
ncbi:MAG: MFS transporter [Streptosporangiales bacterium]